MVGAMDHVGVVVRGIDGALPYFVEELGLDVVGREYLPEVGVRLAYLAAGSTLLQLVEPIANGPLRDHLDSHGEGLHHVCFAVPDLLAAVALLVPEGGVRIVQGGRERRACFLPDSANGLRIELTEAEPSGSR